MILDFGFGVLDFGILVILDFGFWEFWILDLEILGIWGIWDFGIWILGILDFGFLILDLGFWGGRGDDH